MDLVTCCNSEFFFNNTKKLINSFLSFYPNSNVKLCVFGELASSLFNTKETQSTDSFEIALKTPDLPNTLIFRIPQDCEHAWNPRFYYFKTAALKIGMNHCQNSFIWLDSCNRVVDILVEVEEFLERDSRFFDQYPHTEFYKIKNYTTALCVKKLGLTQEQIQDWYGYQSLIQAYSITKENEKFVDTMLSYMKDPEIAGPSNHLEKPDGPNSCVRHHRNDLSVLSLLIPKFGFDQPYDIDKSRRYGDQLTYETFGGCEKYNWEPRILTRQQ